jgi:hypothetical protein
VRQLLFREKFGQSEELVLQGQLKVTIQGIGLPFEAFPWDSPWDGFTSSAVVSMQTVDGVLEIRTQNSIYRLRQDRRQKPGADTVILW